MNHSGFYVLCKPGSRQVTELEAKQLIRKLLTNDPCVQWAYDERTLSANAFVGQTRNGSTDRIQLSMHDVPHHNSRILMECWCNGTYCCINDLCYEPEQSELRRLYMQVASIVHQTPKPKFRYKFSLQGAMPSK